MMNCTTRRLLGLTFLTASIVAGSLAGCSSSIKTSPAVHSARIDSAKVSESARVAEGQTLTVHLPTNGGTMFRWRLAPESSNNGVVNLKDRFEQRDAFGSIAGAGEPAADIFTFRARDVGATTLTFIYDCPLNVGQSQTKRMTLDVEVFDPRTELATMVSAESSDSTH